MIKCEPFTQIDEQNIEQGISDDNQKFVDVYPHVEYLDPYGDLISIVRQTDQTGTEIYSCIYEHETVDIYKNFDHWLVESGLSSGGLKCVQEMVSNKEIFEKDVVYIHPNYQDELTSILL